MTEQWEVEMARAINAKFESSAHPWLRVDSRNVRDLVMGLVDVKSIDFRARVVRYSERLQSREGEA